MAGLFGYPHRRLISLSVMHGILLTYTTEQIIRPPDPVQSLLPRLSQDSLLQLERNAKEPTAAHKALRVRNWVQALSTAANPLFDATARPYQNGLRGPTQRSTHSAGRNGQSAIHNNTVRRLVTRGYIELAKFSSQYSLS